MLKLIVLTAALLLVLVVAGGKKRKKASETPDAEYGTDEAFLMKQPVVLNAVKMHRVLKDQAVVATCRYLLYKAWKTFYEARDSCRNLTLPMTLRTQHGSLATIKTEEENKDLAMLLKLGYGVRRQGGKYRRDNWVWVALEKVLNNDVKLAKSERGTNGFNASEWRWLDGSEPTFTRWQRGMPDQQHERKSGEFQDHVAVSKKGEWDDTFPRINMPYVCNYCGKYIVVEKHVKWNTARDLCESFGLTLAIVNSVEENNDLAAAGKLVLGEYTDPKRWNNTNWIWIGTREVMDEGGVGTGVWQHHDGSPLLWEPLWDWKRQPDDYVVRRGEEQVAAFSRINKHWDDSFVHRKRPFACMCPEEACISNIY